MEILIDSKVYYIDTDELTDKELVEEIECIEKFGVAPSRV